MEKSILHRHAAEWLSQVTIRHLQEADLPALEWGGEFKHFRRIYAEAFQRMQNGMASHWVAEQQRAGVIGQAFIQLTCDRPELADGYARAYLYSFRIKPAYRNGGLGSLMLSTIEDDLRARDFEILTLNVAKDNKAALRLYHRMSYRVVAHEPGIWSYPDEHGIWHQMEEPAWRMEKEL
jgi:ribosomal protein S18 acetylase RimI-like enzyme